MIEDGRRRGPAVVQVDLERRATANDVDVIIVLLNQRGVVDDNPANRWQEAAGARHIVDITGVALVPADGAEGGIVADRQVDHAFDLATLTALGDGVHLGIDATFQPGCRRLVGDDPDRAGLRRCPVQGTLRPRQRLDPGDVIDMHIKRTADGRDRLLVEIEANRRQ